MKGQKPYLKSHAKMLPGRNTGLSTDQPTPSLPTVTADGDAGCCPWRVDVAVNSLTRMNPAFSVSTAEDLKSASGVPAWLRPGHMPESSCKGSWKEHQDI